MSEPPKEDPYGQICWLEIPVKDVARAQKLYTELFGWECSSEVMESPTPGIQKLYSFQRGKLHGCMALMEDGHHILNADADKPAALPVLPTFNIKSIEEATEIVEKHGGKTQVAKTAIGGPMGFFARFIDTEGNLIGVWAQN